MPAYADTSFLVRAYTPHADSQKALTWLQNAREPLPFTPLHRHELRNAIRLRVFRGEITAEQRKLAFQEIESDLADNILAHTPIPWTDAFRESEDLAAIHTEKLGVRSFDLLHVGLALALKATEFLTCDTRQASLAKAAGLKVKP
jgi:predicted nucleic acid-binding protein